LEQKLQLLPNLHNAVVPKEKPHDYVLNPDHPQGRHKARVFKSMLGIERQHAEVLAEIIIASLSRAAAQQSSANECRWNQQAQALRLQRNQE
jgi:hypothetical protein